MTSSREVKCPQCGLLTFYSPENPFRPFCSERCRLIDLGQWASESYKVPLQPAEGYQYDTDIDIDDDPANTDLQQRKQE